MDRRKFLKRFVAASIGAGLIRVPFLPAMQAKEIVPVWWTFQDDIDFANIAAHRSLSLWWGTGTQNGRMHKQTAQMMAGELHAKFRALSNNDIA